MWFHRLFSCIKNFSVLHISQVKLLFYTKMRSALTFASFGVLVGIFRKKTKVSNLVTPQVKRERSEERQRSTPWVATACPYQKEKDAKKRLEDHAYCSTKIEKFELDITCDKSWEHSTKLYEYM